MKASRRYRISVNGMNAMPYRSGVDGETVERAIRKFDNCEVAKIDTATSRIGQTIYAIAQAYGEHLNSGVIERHMAGLDAARKEGKKDGYTREWELYGWKIKLYG